VRSVREFKLDLGNCITACSELAESDVSVLPESMRRIRSSKGSDIYLQDQEFRLSSIRCPVQVRRYRACTRAISSMLIAVLGQRRLNGKYCLRIRTLVKNFKNLMSMISRMRSIKMLQVNSYGRN
jgi:hypothetical protein